VSQGLVAVLADVGEIELMDAKPSAGGYRLTELEPALPAPQVAVHGEQRGFIGEGDAAQAVRPCLVVLRSP